MLTEIYIQALLVDEELADHVWELWDAGVIDDELVAVAWLTSAVGLWNQRIDIDHLDRANLRKPIGKKNPIAVFATTFASS